MPLEMAEQLASDLAGMGTLTVELIGRGEPLLHPQFTRLVEIFRRYGLEVILYTNGVLLSREMAKTLVEMGVRTIRLSINAGNAETHQKIAGLGHQGDFEKILDSAQALVNFRKQSHKQLPFVFYGFVLLQHNFTEAKLAIQHAAQIGLDAVYFKQSISHDVCCDYAIRNSTALEAALDDAKAEALCLGIHTNLNLRESLPIERENYRSASLTVYSCAPCYLPWFFTLITSDGTVHSCCQCAHPMGNLTTQTFRDIWKGPSYRQFRLRCKELPKHGVQSIPGCECYNCNYAVRNLVLHNLLSLKGTGNVGGIKRTKIVKDMLRFKDV
jgi:MoaA/NifB/PqqE/SkfB family radical SAM enzyme